MVWLQLVQPLVTTPLADITLPPQLLQPLDTTDADVQQPHAGAGQHFGAGAGQHFGAGAQHVGAGAQLDA
jgi:hypothetical protein